MKKIEQIATLLIKKGISFNYQHNGISITDLPFLFTEVYYGKTSKELVFIDQEYKKVETEDAIQAIKEYKYENPFRNN